MDPFPESSTSLAAMLLSIIKKLRLFKPDDKALISLKAQITYAYTQGQSSKLSVLHQDISMATEQEIGDAVRCYLQTQWQEVSDSLLCYTAQPDAPITEHSIALALAITASSEGSEQEHFVRAINVLLPTVIFNEQFTPQEVGHKDIKAFPATIEGIQQFLKTHILSEQLDFFIPVWILLLQDPEGTNKLRNVYYVPEHHQDRWYLSEQEIRRLSRHSPLLANVYQNRAQVLQLQQQGNNLLTQLHQLAARLHENSVEQQGQETVEAGSGYEAIGHFSRYYAQLPQSQLTTLPKPLIEQIVLLEKCFNPFELAPQDRIEEIDTCLSTRRNALLHSMQGLDGQLATIAIDEQERNPLVMQTQQHYQQSLQELLHAIKQGDYNGYDALPIRLRLVSQFNISLALSDVDDFIFLVTQLPISELQHLLDNKALRDALINFTRNSHTLSQLLLQIPETQLRLIFDVVPQLLPSALSKNLAHTAEILHLLNQEKRQFIIKYSHLIQIEILDKKDHAQLLHHAIKYPAVFDDLFNQIPPLEQTTALTSIDTKGNTLLHLAIDEANEALFDKLIHLLPESALITISQHLNHSSENIGHHLAIVMPQRIAPFLEQLPENIRAHAILTKAKDGDSCLTWLAEFCPAYLKLVLQYLPYDKTISRQFLNASEQQLISDFTNTVVKYIRRNFQCFHFPNVWVKKQAMHLAEGQLRILTETMTQSAIYQSLKPHRQQLLEQFCLHYFNSPKVIQKIVQQESSSGSTALAQLGMLKGSSFHAEQISSQLSAQTRTYP